VRSSSAPIRALASAGGSFCFVDPDARIAMAYIMNQKGPHLLDAPREEALRDATDRAVAKLGPGL